ncbi:MAG: hypothetical protein WA655_07880 [Candidatus Korobacteraceae bacterium]
MKRIFIPGTLLLTLLLSLTAFAKTKSADVDIYQTSQVAGTTLQPGSYGVAVSPNGSTASVSFSRNGKQVATVTGQVVQLQKKAANTSVTMDNSGSTPTISQIDFEGSTTSVSFSSTASASASGE